MRCYNGCPDSDLQSLLDSRDAARAELSKVAKSLGKRGICTYFPLEDKYRCCDGNYKEISTFHNSVEGACAEAIKRLSHEIL